MNSTSNRAPFCGEVCYFYKLLNMIFDSQMINELYAYT